QAKTTERGRAGAGRVSPPQASHRGGAPTVRALSASLIAAAGRGASGGAKPFALRDKQAKADGQAAAHRANLRRRCHSPHWVLRDGGFSGVKPMLSFRNDW